LKYKIVKKNNFSKKEWKNIYKNKKIKLLQKDIFRLETKLLNVRNDENHKLSREIVNNNNFKCCKKDSKD